MAAPVRWLFINFLLSTVAAAPLYDATVYEPGAAPLQTRRLGEPDWRLDSITSQGDPRCIGRQDIDPATWPEDRKRASVLEFFHGSDVHGDVCRDPKTQVRVAWTATLLQTLH